MKPAPENMSVYCKNKAFDFFSALIFNLNVKYLVVSYNNTYNSRSSSSKNKMELDEIKTLLEKRGSTKVFCKNYQAFNAGKTEISDHKEYIFFTEVNK
jgi:adenine-specific DNA-methyltransferase